MTISSKGASRPSSLCLSLHHLRHHQLQHQLLQQPIQLLHVTAITVVHQQGATLAASASVSPSPPDPGEACAPAGPLPQRRPLHPKSTAVHCQAFEPSSLSNRVITLSAGDKCGEKTCEAFIFPTRWLCISFLVHCISFT